MDPILIVKDLRKIYPGKPPFEAVCGIDFTLDQGEILGLLGPNGAGKTTTIQMLMSTLTPTSGTISYFNKDLKKCRTEILKKVTFASTYVSLPWNLTIEQNLDVFGRLFSLHPRDFKKRRDELLERFGISSKRKNRVSSLSSGQVTRLMLVKAFMVKPRIVLLDEPTASLDPDIAKDVIAFVLEQREKEGTSILFTSHNMEEVTQVCDRVLFLKKGAVYADDLPHNLAKQAAPNRLCLTMDGKMAEAVKIANKLNLKPEMDRHHLELELDEGEIARFLTALAKEGILYSNIRIIQPTLEDFFLQAASEGESL